MSRSIAPIVAALLLVGCSAPDASQMFSQMDVRVTADEEATALEFIPVIEGATEDLAVALPSATYLPLTDAIIAAHADGVNVRVITDIDQRNDPGIVALQDAEVPLRLADGEVEYFDFGFNQDSFWSSDQVRMSHAYAVADGLQIVNATRVGGSTTGAGVVFQLTGEELAEDLLTEHNQVFGGSDATALTSFSAQAKSVADVRWLYQTDSDTPVEVWLGPQERVTKRIIDAIYSARISVRVLTNELANDGINRAVQAKARWGFDTTVVVGPDFRSTGLGRDLVQQTPDVPKFQFTETTSVPTVVLIDIEGGRDVTPRAYIVSHDLYSAERYFGNGTPVITDQLIDGNLFVLTDWDYVEGEDPESPIDPLVDLYNDHLNRAGNL